MCEIKMRVRVPRAHAAIVSKVDKEHERVRVYVELHACLCSYATQTHTRARLPRFDDIIPDLFGGLMQQQQQQKR